MTANELKAVMAKLDRLLDENDRLRAERDRLRKALNFYACACKYDGEDCDNALDAAYCGRIARTALKGGGDE